MAKTLVNQSGVNNPNYKGHMHRKCQQCSGPIGGSSTSRKFCSNACYAVAQRVPHGFKTCPYCGKDFYHSSNKHCSAACAIAVREARSATTPKPTPRGPKQPRACATCAKGFLVRPSESDRKYCCRACYGVAVGKRQSGEKHHNYIDGRTQERQSIRQELRRHKDYSAWRNKVFARDGWKCRACLAEGGSLNAHHHVGWSSEPTLRLKVSNGITLCDGCHRTWHAYEKKGMFVGKEAALQNKVLSALREYGFFVFNVPGTPMGASGLPDSIVCFNGLFGGIEFKVFPNYLTEQQRHQAEAIKASGGLYFVAQSEDDIGRIIESFEESAAAGSWSALHDVSQLDELEARLGREPI